MELAERGHCVLTLGKCRTCNNCYGAQIVMTSCKPAITHSVTPGPAPALRADAACCTGGCRRPAPCRRRRPGPGRALKRGHCRARSLRRLEGGCRLQVGNAPHKDQHCPWRFPSQGNIRDRKVA
jgi:hypothetical protein